jgi:hypothetical protein
MQHAGIGYQQGFKGRLQSAGIGQLARHHPVPVIPVGNFPEKSSFRECSLLRQQA